MLDDKKLNQLKKYFATQPVDVVYLFGSQVKGKSRSNSDLDIGVLFKEGLSKSKRFDLRLEYMSAVGLMTDFPDKVDVVDLEEASTALRYSAVSAKQEIVSLNDDRRALFEAETNSRYFDLDYYIKQNTHYSLASIARMKG